jgi:chemotaxis response regulator CheB
MAAKRTPKRGARLSRTKSSRKKSQRSNLARQRSRSNRLNKNLSCPIVGIGGLAGGFEAAMELLRRLPLSTGMAFVIVQHLDPHHASRSPKLNVRERKVRDREGREYSLRVRPYRTTDNKIDGAVITLVDLEGK